MPTTRDWPRLGRYVLERRNELGLTQEEVAAHGGPSTATIRNIETTGKDVYRAKSLRQIAEALGWTPDSSWAILNGREPRPQPSTGPDPEPAALIPRPRDGRFQVLPGGDGHLSAHGVNVRALGLVTGVLGPDATELRAVIQAAGPGATGADIFDDPALAGIWDLVLEGACSEAYALTLMSVYVLRRRASAEAEDAHQAGLTHPTRLTSPN